MTSPQNSGAGNKESSRLVLSPGSSTTVPIPDSGDRLTGLALAARLKASWPLTGRESELASLGQSFGLANAQSVYLFGQAGVGKTRLASELRSQAELQGIPTLRIMGTATAKSVPFGAVAHLLQQQHHGHNGSGERNESGPVAREATNEAAILVGSIQRTIRAHAKGRVVVFVDDAHLLDSLSATVVAALIANGDAQVVATVRLGEDLHDALLSGLRSGEAARIDLTELGDTEVDAVLFSVLGASVEPRALVALRSNALGNMLYLRELVIGAVESGALAFRNGMWRLVGSIAPSTRLRDLLSARLSSFSSGNQHAIALLAVGGSIPLELLESLASDADLVHLEESAILAVVETHPIGAPAGARRQTEVMFAHPLFGEEVLGRVSKLRLRTIRMELAEAIEASGSQTPQDLLRVAVLRLDAGAQGNAKTLARGAYLARYATDFFLTARLAEAAFADESEPALGLMLGEALYETGRFDEAVIALRCALSMATDEHLIIAIGGQLLTVLFWGTADDAAADGLVNELFQRLTIPECLGALLAHKASIATFSGFPSQGLELLNYLPDTDDPFAFCQISVTLATTLSLVGRTTEALANTDRAIELHAGFAEPLLLPHPSIHEANGAFALLHGGHPARALARAKSGYEHAINDRLVVSLVWCQLMAGEASLVMGRGADALRHFETALHDAMRELYRGQVAMAWAGIAMARALLGDVEGSRTALSRSDAETSRIGLFDLNVCVARATVMTASGEFGSACIELQRGVEVGLLGGNVIGEAWLLHELCRLGMFAAAAARLDVLASSCDNELVHARAAHAAALAADSALGLVAVGETFMKLGFVIVAAEAAMQASSSYQRSGDDRRANASALRSAAMAEGTDIALAPNASSTSTLTPLTAREREIAYLASQGSSNKEISELLFLSTRTVENHLSKVFVKLGVTTRQGLHAALAMGTV
jgi:DNA-binding CsgD family transcriptional regulator/tetratricopeptide (TPR) repeat protein